MSDPVANDLMSCPADTTAESALQNMSEIPPFPRAPENGTRLATENMLIGINNKIAKLARLGLRPHPNLIEYRLELMEQLKNNGPYRVRWSSGTF